MPIHFYNPNMLVGLWLVPVMVGLFLYAAVKRKRALKTFGARTAPVRRMREAAGACSAVALLILALARPAWDLEEKEVQEMGRDVIFLLDVSRSMLAEDMHPNRLENAKISILDCVEALSGDRVGLVLFAGSAEIRCPLTMDYAYFRMALRQASPESVAAGGTMMANAIEKVVHKLIDTDKAGMQDLILITDGEDMVEGNDELEAAKRLAEARVRLIAIGLGDRAHGSRIALKDETTGVRSFMKHGNVEVWTKLHSETLRRMAAAAPDSLYFDVGSGPFDLARIYRQVMENADRTSTDSRTMERYKEQFPLFLGTAVLLLLFSTRRRKSREG